MELREAVRLIAPAVVPRGGMWADLGAGSGTFTSALAHLLGPGGGVIAVERDDSALRALERLAAARPADRAAIEVRRADVTALPPLPPLDGVLLANVLHFVPGPRQAALLGDLATRVRESGHIAIVEYEERRASRWVPYPVSFATLAALADEAGLPAPTRVAMLPSRFGGVLYSALIER